MMKHPVLREEREGGREGGREGAGEGPGRSCSCGSRTDSPPNRSCSLAKGGCGALSTLAFLSCCSQIDCLRLLCPASPPRPREQRPKDEVSFLGYKAKWRRAESGSGGKQIMSPWEVLEGGWLAENAPTGSIKNRGV